MAYPSPKQLRGRLQAAFVNETKTGATNKGPGEQNGSLAQTISPVGKFQEIDVVKDYRWTLSKLPPEELKEVPYISLQEFKCSETSIRKQINFYANLGLDSIASVAGVDRNKAIEQLNKVVDFQEGKFESVLDPYKDIWPQDNPTGFKYKFPYFNKVGLELTSEPWAALDSIGEAVKGITGGIGDILSKKMGQGLQQAFDLASAGRNLALQAQYPSVGVTDRPKVFMAHNDRTINISFVLYNTLSQLEWVDNLDLIQLLMSQNLFNKRDYTTGVPPVFYTVYIPGQYFCYAACLTNFKVEHLGNQRLLNYGGEYIIPDAYQVDITLTELVKPSKNQFQAITTGEALSHVSVITVDGPRLNGEPINNFNNIA
jgi:hypothetical protein